VWLSRPCRRGPDSRFLSRPPSAVTLVGCQDPRSAPRVLSTRPRPPRRAGRDRGDLPQACLPVLAAAHHRAGLRVQTPDHRRPQTPGARTPRRCRHQARHPTHQGHAHDQTAQPPRTATHTTSRTRLPTSHPGLAGHRNPAEWCGRHTGARISKAVKRHSSAAGNSPRTCALARGHPHQPKRSHAERNPSTQPLTFMRRSKR
jgi:hypothetical protein